VEFRLRPLSYRAVELSSAFSCNIHSSLHLKA